MTIEASDQAAHMCSLCTFVQSDQSNSLMGALWLAKGLTFLQAENKNSDQTVWMCRLLWMSSVRTYKNKNHVTPHPDTFVTQMKTWKSAEFESMRISCIINFEHRSR